MKKPLAILLAFFIVFAPIYSNAVLPALAATVASNGGRVLIGQTIKKVAPQALNNARKAMVGICKANPAKCSALGIGVGGLTSAIVGDGWNIDIINNDVTNDIDVDIFKINDGKNCEISFGYHNGTASQAQSMTAYYNYMLGLSNQVFPDTTNTPAPDWQAPFLAFENKNIAGISKTQIVTEWRSIGNNIHYLMKREKKDKSSPSYLQGNNANGAYKCLPYPTNKTYITNNELNQYITNNNINDIDILDIYNFDFSQYNNITIGGDTYNGTTVNNDLAKSDPSETDKKVSADLKKKLDAKELSLDDVTDENCTKNEAGEYDKCGADTEPDPDNPDTDNPDEPEPEKNPACELEENLFRKKICEWIDWTQTKHDKPESGNVDIIDKSDGLEINEDRIVFDDQCPPPTPIELVVMGFPYSEELDYQPFCDFFGMLNPFVVGMGGISSALIIAGGVRRG